MGAQAVGRKVFEENGNCELREPQISYTPLFGLEKLVLRPENSFIWDVIF